MLAPSVLRLVAAANTGDEALVVLSGKAKALGRPVVRFVPSLPSPLALLPTNLDSCCVGEIFRFTSASPPHAGPGADAAGGRGVPRRARRPPEGAPGAASTRGEGGQMRETERCCFNRRRDENPLCPLAALA